MEELHLVEVAVSTEPIHRRLAIAHPLVSDKAGENHSLMSNSKFLGINAQLNYICPNR